VKILYSYTSLHKSLFLFLSLILLVSFTKSYSQDSGTEHKRFQNTPVFGLGGGVTFSQTDYETSKIGYAISGSGEYFFKTNSIHYIGLKLNLNYDQVTGEDSRGTVSTGSGPVNIPPKFSTGSFSAGLALTYGVLISNVVLPYLSGGVAGILFDPTDGNGQPLPGNAASLYDKNTVAYNVEGGVKIFVSEKLSVNISASQFWPQTDYLDDVAAAYSDDAFTTVLVGVSFSPFYNSDSDNDGITGSNDLCPNEPEDFDGFQDDDGCPDVDNDGDGILDVNDKCPNDAEDFDGFEDEDGCPDLDNDGDGILDVNDKCPNEAEDFDGIDDEDGCPDLVELIGAGTFVLSADNLFDPNSAMIKVEGKKYLDEVVSDLQKYPDEKWRIEGYMDSNGNKKTLRNLSLERAKAVLEYLNYFGGLNRENFQVFGMGDNSPIADNNTEEGRKENRRIEIVPENGNNSQNNINQPEEEFNQFILRGDDTFEPNSATLKDMARILLTEVATYIKSQTGSKWKIEGYMDNQGSASLLKKLSYNRAKTVYEYLVSEGLSSDQFTIYGQGSANPISTNDTEEGRSTNRRVLIIREK
jgi:outer membrane protein OmpA-like peptidoglycan-associated protein/opacity protein-like surface antigen